MNELYLVTGLRSNADTVTADVRLNPGHAIFSGHFPGQPVLPGVCMMELVRDVAEQRSGRLLRITGGPMIKFLHMVDPRVTPELVVEMALTEKEEIFIAEGRLINGALIFVRFRLELTAVPAPAAGLHEIS